jgi:uncharacterized protein YyaL (SSP411 family)
MQRPNFSVVSGVVAVLAGMAFLSKLFVGLIPAGPENRLGAESAEFLTQAAHEEIDWRILDEAVFSEARKKDRPIMLVVGTACSPTGRASDKILFRTKEVRGFLARNFICVRVDGMARPEFVNAFLPISRAIEQKNGRLAIPPDFQVWFLDPKGYLFGYAAETVAGQALDSRVFLAALTDVINRFESYQSTGKQAGDEQRRDLAAIASPVSGTSPNIAAYLNALDVIGNPTFGGFPVNGFQRLWPLAWQLQLMAGRYQDYANSIAPCLLSPQVDVLDGGFYTDSASMDWHSVGFDKLTVTNVGMMQTLATGSVVMRDPQQKWFALQTFDCLMRDFVQDGLLAAGQIGDEGVVSRSDRSSFSPRQLRELFPKDEDREWARENLGLKVESNPQMVPLLARLNLPMTDGRRFESVLNVLRGHRSHAKFAGLGQLDVGGFAVARMMQTSRIFGDEERLSKAETLFERLEEYRTLNDVRHSRARDSGVYLGDYLAYADAALQYFLSTGSEIVLHNGVEVLRRGLFLFEGQAPGVYTLSQRATTALAPQDAAAPEIVDNVRESCTAQVIRLCHDYGRLLGKSGEDLRKTARETVGRFALISPALGQFAAGYYCSAAQLLDSRFAVAVGKDAVRQARGLFQRRPFELVAPSVGIVAKPGKLDGIYLVSDSGIQGPLTPARAAELLTPRSY